MYEFAKWSRGVLVYGFITAMRHLPASWITLGAARGIYSELDRLKSRQVTGKVIASSQDVSTLTLDSLRKVANLGQEGHQPWPIFWTLQKNARLVGSTLALRDRQKQLALEAVYDVHGAKDPANTLVGLPKSKRLTGNWTSLVSLWCCRETYFNYYHWLMDGLPRLAALSHFPSDTRILVPHNLPKFCWDALRFLNLEDRVRETSERHLEIDNYFFSSPTAMTGCENPYAIEFLRRNFLPAADQSYHGPQKFYIRRKGKTRGFHREDSLFEILQQKKWEVIDLEELTFAQQIALFSQARAIIGAHGAGFTNLAWCQPGCVAMELFASSFLNGCYESIASCVRVHHQYRIYPADEHSLITIENEQFEEMLVKIDSEV